MKGIFIIILILGLLFLYFLFSISIKNEENNKNYVVQKLPTIFSKPYLENFDNQISSKENIRLNSSNDNPNYLYPIRGLQSICAKDGLKPSFMPKACSINNVLNPYANCKCEDESGNCKLCYATIDKDSKNSNIVYGGDNF